MVTKKDLADIGDSDYDNRRGEFIHCPDCGNEVGGTRGDYFNLSDDYAFVCECSNKDLQLVRRESRLVVIKQ